MPTSSTNGPSVDVVKVNGDEATPNKPADEMTSRDYYFDSYAHFGIHEVRNSFSNIDSESHTCNTYSRGQ